MGIRGKKQRKMKYQKNKDLEKHLSIPFHSKHISN
jgi:hypothetical protein